MSGEARVVLLCDECDRLYPLPTVRCALGVDGTIKCAECQSRCSLVVIFVLDRHPGFSTLDHDSQEGLRELKLPEPFALVFESKRELAVVRVLLHLCAAGQFLADDAEAREIAGAMLERLEPNDDEPPA